MNEGVNESFFEGVCGGRVAVWKIPDCYTDTNCFVDLISFVSCNYLFPMKTITIIFFDLMPLNLYHFLPGRRAPGTSSLTVCFSHGRDLAMSVGLLVVEAGHVGPGLSGVEFSRNGPLDCCLEESWSWEQGLVWLLISQLYVLKFANTYLCHDDQGSIPFLPLN